MSRDSLKRLMPSSVGIPAEIVDVQAVPTIHQLTGKMRAVKRGKAPGPDGLLPDVIKAGAGPMIKHISAITTKIALLGREPDSWRGGRLVPLHKGKAARSDPEG